MVIFGCLSSTLRHPPPSISTRNRMQAAPLLTKTLLCIISWFLCEGYKIHTNDIKIAACHTYGTTLIHFLFILVYFVSFTWIKYSLSIPTLPSTLGYKVHTIDIKIAVRHTYGTTLLHSTFFICDYSNYVSSINSYSFFYGVIQNSYKWY